MIGEDLNMKEQLQRELYRQCLRCAHIYYLETQRKIIAAHAEHLAQHAVSLIQRNREFVPSDTPKDPYTGVPDNYVADVVKYLAEEGPFVRSLAAGDPEVWERMLALLEQRVYKYLGRHNDRGGMFIPQDSFRALAEELVQHCAFLIWLRLDRYRYDSRFEAWVSSFVSYEVSGVCGSAGFRHNTRAVSLDVPLGSAPDFSALGEIIPDEYTEQVFQKLDRLLALENEITKLSKDQRELIQRSLEGQTAADIARDMGRSENAVYKLRQRALRTLRASLCPAPEHGGS